MSRHRYHRNTGGAWATGLGLLGLLITIGIIIWLVKIQTDSYSNIAPGVKSPKGLVEEERKKIEGFSARNQSLGQTAEAEASPKPVAATQPAAPPAPKAAAPAPVQPIIQAPVPTPSSAPAGTSGTLAPGTPLGPISPVTPVAPFVQDNPGFNPTTAKAPAKQVNKGMDERNKALEQAIEKSQE